MSSFEKEYYESATFWEGEAVQDENNIIRIEKTASMIPSDTTSVSDIGCGNGVFVNYLQTNFPRLNLIAVDRSKSALRHVKTRKIEGDIAAIPLADRSSDCVSCLEVIEHLPVSAYQAALSELARVSRKYVIISVPYAEKLERNSTQCPQCKSIFNVDLHLRAFSDDAIGRLLESRNFECISIVKTGEQISFRGHYQFVRAFYPEKLRSWRSPICPICGYTNDYSTSTTGGANAVTNISSPHRSLISYFTGLPKLFWPKVTTNYWIIALYQRT
jgi:SAM-dependent methyltransferase